MMKRVISEAGMTGIFHVMATLLFAVFFSTSLFITGVNWEDRHNENIIIEPNSPLRMALIIVVFGGAMLLLGILYDRVLYRCDRNVLLGMVCIASLLIGIYWVRSCGAVPEADQGLVCSYANAFNDGDFQGIMGGRYMARYMQQLGLVTFLRGLFLVFGRDNYTAFQYFSALTVPLLIFSGCQIVRKLSGNNGKAEMYYLALIVTCFPMYAYTTFVYGDLSSTAVIAFAAWMLLECLEKLTVLRAAALALAVGAAVQLRRNTLIVLIAFCIVILIRLFRKWDWSVLATGCCVVAGALLLQAAVVGLYRDWWDDTAQEIPAILFIAMGLHDTNGYPGWHDNYEYIVFAENGDDVEVATQIALEDMQFYLQRFRENPGYMWSFYKYKINSQWQAPLYQSLVMNKNIQKEQHGLVKIIFDEGILSGLIKLYMKAFQLFMYGCILLWLLLRFRKRPPIESYVLLIAVFGGFLFSILWEAKTRYVMPYMLLMIPYFGIGMSDLMDRLLKFAGKLWKKG